MHVSSLEFSVGKYAYRYYIPENYKDDADYNNKLSKGCKRADRLLVAKLNRDVRELIDNAEEITIDRVTFEHEMPDLGFETSDELEERSSI